jgi:SAM-dependent methyltransferase
VCQVQLPAEPLLSFANMPKAAQLLPKLEDLEFDRGIDLEIFQCPGCGLVQTSGEPVPYYKEVIRAAGISAEMRAFRLGQFTEFIERYQLRGKRLLEVGCGQGEYLSIFQECGAQTYGIEASEKSVNFCEASGLVVEQNFIEDSNQVVAGGPFDAFAVLNFMEHWPDPNATLSGIANNLVPNGIGLVEVPNFDMILKKNLFTEFISDHIFYFTAESLETTLRLNGFEVIQIRPVWYDYILSAVVRRRSPHDVSSFSAAHSSLQNAVNKFINEGNREKIAIWGAGHQALATMALLNIGSAISYVVDSAPFKQGRYTPSSHVPILPPDSLHDDPVGSIIIMAAAYSDEIASIIKQKYSYIKRVAILREDHLEVVKNDH